MTERKEKRVLVVDDDPDVRYFLSSVLEDAGLAVETASNGDEALERLRVDPPDLVSLDLIMPGRSGIKVMHEMRRNPVWARIPVIVVTGHCRDGAVRRDLEEVLADASLAGPGVCLEKPVNEETYLRQVRRALGLEDEEPAKAQGRAGELRARAAELLAAADERTLGRLVSDLEAASRPKRGLALVVDDEEDVRAFLTEILRDQGVEVRTLDDGVDVVAEARRLAPDVIFLDIAMPRVSGIRVFRDLRKDAVLAKIPVVVVTGLMEDFEHFLGNRRAAAPPEGYLVKPFEPDAVVAALAPILETRARRLAR